MFKGIKTTKENKELVTLLTRKLNLGAENIIARLAFAYSLQQERVLKVQDCGDSQGKEYTTKVLFGEYADIYIGMVCMHYGIYRTDRDIGRYVKMHVDDGLALINKEVEANDMLTGIDFIINKVEAGLKKNQ